MSLPGPAATDAEAAARARNADLAPAVGSFVARTERVQLGAKDFAIALLLAALAFALYRATFQARQFGDSSLLVQEFAAHSDGTGFWYHALYMPAAGLLGRLFEPLSPPAVLRLLSSVCGALGVAFTYLLARGWRTGRTAALLAAGLLALSPGYWFFSTMIEVHTLHAACVGWCALLTLAAPWQRPVWAALGIACALPILFLSHQSGVLLGPGFVLLSQYARVARGRTPFRARTLFLGLGPLYLAALVAAIPLSAWLGQRSAGGLVGGSSDALAEFTVGFSAANAWEGWIQPLGLLLPLALAGAVAGRLRSWAVAAPLAFFLPSAFFFLVWGLPERGGYTLGSSMFLAPLAALALARLGRRALLLGGLALALQGAWGCASLRAFDAPQWRRESLERKQAIVQAIGERGGVISINAKFQYIEAELPQVVELSLVEDLARTLGRDESPEVFLAHARARLEPFLSREDFPIVLDRSYVGFLQRVSPQALAYSEAMEAWLQAHYLLVPVAATDWPLVRVFRPPTPPSD